MVARKAQIFLIVTNDFFVLRLFFTHEICNIRYISIQDIWSKHFSSFPSCVIHFSCSCSFVLCDAQRCAPFVQQLFEVKLKLGNQLPTLPTAMGGLWKALLCLLWLVASAWPWGPPVWQGDVWWRLHMPTNYWYQCDQYGTLLWDDDWNWLQYEGYELLQTVNTVRLREAPRSPACKRPRHRHGLEGIPEEEEIGFGGGSSSHGPPRARAGGQNDGLMALLNQLSDMLGQEGGSSRYDSRGFRSAVRRQLKKLCRQYQLKLPPWVDGEGMTVKEFKKRTRWFIEDFMLQQTAVAGPKGGGLGKAKEEEESDGEEEEEEESPTTDGAESPQNKGGTAANTSAAPAVGPPGAAGPTAPAEPCVPGATGGQCDGPSSARIITHMMDNLLDNMETLHPGVREEVAASLCSAGPSGIAGLPAQGMSEETNPTEGAVDGNVAAESSGLNKAPPMEEVLGENAEVKDPREVQSEPPVSPRPMGEEDTEPPTPEGWPEQGPLASLAEPPPSEASWVHVPSGPAEFDETSTVASFTLEDVPQVDPPS